MEVGLPERERVGDWEKVMSEGLREAQKGGIQILAASRRWRNLDLSGEGKQKGWA